MNKRTKKNISPRKYNGYTATEQDLLNFCRWALIVAFMFLVIAAIITTNENLMTYSVIVGVFIAYGVYKHWFDV